MICLDLGNSNEDWGGRSEIYLEGGNNLSEITPDSLSKGVEGLKNQE